LLVSLQIRYNKKINKDKKQLAFCSLRSLNFSQLFFACYLGVMAYTSPLSINIT
jgi:hypothetical protein